MINGMETYIWGYQVYMVLIVSLVVWRCFWCFFSSCILLFLCFGFIGVRPPDGARTRNDVAPAGRLDMGRHDVTAFPVTFSFFRTSTRRAYVELQQQL